MNHAMSDKESDALGKINTDFTRHSLQSWLFFALLFFIFLFVREMFPGDNHLVIEAIPSLKRIHLLQTDSSRLAAEYFSVGILFVPLVAIFLGVHQKMHLRLKAGLARQPSRLKGLFTIYFLALPFFLILLSFYYWLPIDLANPRLFGQQLINLMIQSRVALCLMGSFSLMVLAYVLLIIGSIVSFPFRSLIDRLSSSLC